MITERQEKLLNFLVKEYIGSAEPVSSELLKKSGRMEVSPATIRNDLKELANQGYISQPHTSAGRVPTQKAYIYFAEKIILEEDPFSDFVFEEIEKARQEIENELRMAEEMMKSLERASSTFEITYIKKRGNLSEILQIISTSKINQNQNREVINRIIKEFENL